MKEKIAAILVLVSLNACANEYYYEHGKKVTLTSVEQNRAMSGNDVHYYVTEYGHKVAVTNELIVQCESDVNCTDVLKSHSLKNISKLSKTLFLAEVNKGDNIFKVSQKLHEDKNILFAHPNFKKTMKRR
ncbi:MAG: hypothetical protein Q9M39_08550 [Sulfurovum sp.]|nr:hypothetical protein [Sulfurovum sp.]